MFPVASDRDIAIFQVIDHARFYFPSTEQILSEDGWSVFREYSPAYFGATWDEARACISWERALLARLDIRSRETEEALLDELDEEAFQQPCAGLDLGVGSVVVALSAAGCAPLTSCSGHFGEGTWSQCPLVKVASDEARARILLGIAKLTNCGIANSDEGSGALELWARSIDETVAFADELCRHSSAFDSIVSPLWSEESDGLEVPSKVNEVQGELFANDGRPQGLLNPPPNKEMDT